MVAIAMLVSWIVYVLFVSNITHEMKSPLAAIELHAQTLEDTGVAGRDLQRSVGFILQQVGRMETLVDHVLESSRLIARRTRPPLQPVVLTRFGVTLPFAGGQR